MKEIDKNNYCVHGKSINNFVYRDFKYCSCCEGHIIYEHLLELGMDSKLCKVCLTSPIITELLS